MRGLGEVLDPDVRYSGRKPQFAALFDPRWQVAMYHGIGAGNFGPTARPYAARGTLPFVLASSAITMTRDGNALTPVGTSGAGGGMNVQHANIVGVAPSTVQGTFIVTFRAVTASNAPAVNSNYAMALSQLVGGTWLVQVANDFSNSLYFGWYNNGTDTRVNVSDAGLWAAGDLVTLGFSYSPIGTRAFAKGKLIASSGTAPSTFNTLTTGSGLNWGIGQDPNPSAGNSRFGHSILDALVLDRALTDSEWAHIQHNPLNWPFLPDAELNADLLLTSVAGAAAAAQTAVSMI